MRFLNGPTRIKAVATFCSALLLALSASLALAPNASAETAKIVVEPTSGLRDSQVVTVTWSGFLPYSQIAIRQCVDGATDSSKCSSGAGGLVQEMSDANGEGLAYFQVVSTQGTINTSLPGANGTSCGPDFKCNVVVTAIDDLERPDKGLIAQITFAPEATSCPTENMKNITGGGSGALKAQMPNWQLALCKGKDRVTVDYLATRGDEGGMQDFNCGLTDFAITEIADEHQGKCLSTGIVRKGIYVPIANTALVFAYSMRNRSDQQRIAQIRLTPDMLANTMTGQALNWGSHAVTATKDVDIYALNNWKSPKITDASGDGSTITFTASGTLEAGDTVIVEDVNPPGYNSEYQVTGVIWVDDSDHSKGQSGFTVDGTYKRKYVSGGIVNPTNLLPGSISVYGRADASGLNYLMTRYFLERAADAFHAPGGQFSEEGFPVPSLYMPLANSLDPSAFRSSADAVTLALRGSDDVTGGVGFIAPMDAATAKFNGFPAVSISNGDGSKFVAPTTESVTKGVAQMIKDQKTGVASANLAPSDVDAYPLVFTIYALVPEKTESATAATALKAMLSHVRDSSKQSQLADGYIPLTDEQKTQVTGAISKISGPAPSPSPTPTPSQIPTPEPTTSPTEVPVVSPTLPTDGGIDPGTGTDNPGFQNPITSISQKLPSIFAAPFVPKSGMSAAIIPGLLLLGVVTALLGSLGLQKRE
ncbi:MAG: hypothetical protein KGQ38_00415 [Actinomycetales bacterium]|nr:hypothetical protein [Actinomycetales bacterium]